MSRVAVPGTYLVMDVMENSLALRLVPDDLWERVEPLLPRFETRRQGGGTAPIEDRAGRRVVEAAGVSDRPARRHG
ncbi:hypothetical protein BL254_14665 [Protofrankia sp. BMG5.30]|uniref:Uncharacterized protein n=1 Tax=Protofrankia coriariae TaxID=1562887 RepID=A0ABR5F304_9ACTN|nr:hypothetical protein FrCorBMG51_13920 [Protofrankia coriariae]ONH34672.1 hypothetical protein BL254_14665 [Protofrankia sp. BMG5.30]